MSDTKGHTPPLKSHPSDKIAATMTIIVCLAIICLSPPSVRQKINSFIYPERATGATILSGNTAVGAVRPLDKQLSAAALDKTNLTLDKLHDAQASLDRLKDMIRTGNERFMQRGQEYMHQIEQKNNAADIKAAKIYLAVMTRKVSSISHMQAILDEGMKEIARIQQEEALTTLTFEINNSKKEHLINQSQAIINDASPLAFKETLTLRLNIMKMLANRIV